MRLLFENSYGIMREISNVENEQEAFKKIKEFCEKRNFKIYYIRKWEVNNAALCSTYPYNGYWEYEIQEKRFIPFFVKLLKAKRKFQIIDINYRNC